jgi:pilus assembly protein CpaE
VIEPTVASLRDAARITTQITQAQSNSTTAGELRLITVLNYRLPNKLASVSLQEVEKFTGKPVDIIIPYEEKVDLILLEGLRIADTKSKMASQLKALSSLLLGEEKTVKKQFTLNLFKKRVKS